MPLSMGATVLCPLCKIGMSAHLTGWIPPQHLARQRSGVSGILDNDDAVDQHSGAVAARIAMRICIGGAVVKVGRVEDCYIGAIALAQQAAIAELERAR